MDQRADPVTLTLDGGSFVAYFPKPIGAAPVGPGGQHFIDATSDPILLVADPTTCGGNG